MTGSAPSARTSRLNGHFWPRLPAEVFDPGLVLNPRGDRSSMITVRMVEYSVPARFFGRRVRGS